jgi:type VI secretion system protein ImpA
MPAESPVADELSGIEDLLDPISISQPAGADMRWTAEWDRIKEARRFDDPLGAGKWEKKERKSADWRLVEELARAMLRERTKDLQMVMWLTEAGTKLNGFRGLSGGLRVARELMERYWDQGLYPSIEDGPEDRSGPFEWLNNKLVDSIVAVPITARDDPGEDFSLVDFKDAKRAGGHVSPDQFDNAVAHTRRAVYEGLNADFQRSYAEFKALEVTVDEKFGDVAPSLAACRGALGDIDQALSDILVQKRKAEPDKPAAAIEVKADSIPGPAIDSVILSVAGVPARDTNGAGSWAGAEALIRAGQVETGLAEMTRLAANETCGRNRFERKRLLAEICLASGRDGIARLILEELAEQIDKFQLELWESSELISSVWSRLYRIYKKSGDGDDLDRAGKLYGRLCRLDPWQALGCDKA